MHSPLEMPALRFGHQEVAKDLHACDRLEFLGIDEIGVKRRSIVLAKELHQPAVLLDQIVRKQRDADTALAGAQYAEYVADVEERVPRPLAVARDLNEPVAVLQVGRHRRAAEHHDAVVVELLERAWRAEALDVFGRGV